MKYSPTPTAYRRFALIVITSGMIAAIVGVILLTYLHNPKRGLPYHDSFHSGKAVEWEAFGGTWSVYDGGMRNDSDERGAKLITGSPYWSN